MTLLGQHSGYFLISRAWRGCSRVKAFFAESPSYKIVLFFLKRAILLLTHFLLVEKTEQNNVRDTIEREESSEIQTNWGESTACTKFEWSLSRRFCLFCSSCTCIFHNKNYHQRLKDRYYSVVTTQGKKHTHRLSQPFVML